MASVSLICLIAVILIAWKRKSNPGILGFLFAFALGFFVVAKANGPMISSIKGQCGALFSGFPTKLWIRIMLVSIFFAIAQLDGTLELIVNKSIRMIRGQNKLLPWVFYFVTLIVAATGAGSIGVLILLMPMASAMVTSQKIDFMLTGLGVAIGGAVGGVSPMAPTGIVGVSVAASNGIEVGNGIFTHYLVCGTLTYLILYIIFGGWKYKRAELTEEFGAESFSSKQKITALAILVFATLAIMGYEIAYIAAALIAILSVVNGVDEKKVISMAPWSTLILLAGMSTMIKVVQLAGGINILTDFFKSFMGPSSAGVIMSVVAGFMSFVSSASGVVMPSLIPTVPAIAEATGASALGLINAITFGAHQTGISPFSTGGSLVLSMSGEDIDKNKVFNKLIATAFFMLILGCVYSYFGLLG